MIKEFGMDPNVPGLEITENFVEEDLRYNPNCPCRTRSCSQHGFCKLCTQHHRELAALFERLGETEEAPTVAPGCYLLDHSKPTCHRMPNPTVAGYREDYCAEDYDL